MSKILATNQSSSNPDVIYKIIEGNDGTIYCECPGWKFKRDCKHLKQYHAKSASYAYTDKMDGKGYVREPAVEEDILTKLKGVFNE